MIRLSLPRPRTQRAELLWAAGIVWALAAALDALGGLLPWMRANLVALFAIVFLYVPAAVHARDENDFGLTWEGARRGVRVGLSCTLLLLPLFVAANHVWSTRALGLRAHVTAGALSRPPDAYFGSADVAPGSLHVGHDGALTTVRWTPTSAPWALVLRSDGALWRPGRSAGASPLEVSGDAVRPVAVSVRVVGGSELAISAREDRQVVGPDRFAIGAGADPPRGHVSADGLVVPLGLGWIPLAVAMQLLLIALPEEYFFRGYLQTRIAASWTRRFVRVGPLELSAANAAASCAFAFTHFVVGWDPERLIVVFPSLLFGALRDRTRGLAAGVVFHAGCNLMAELIGALYW